MSAGVATHLPGTELLLRSSRDPVRTRPVSTAEITPTPLFRCALPRSEPLGRPPRSGCARGVACRRDSEHAGRPPRSFESVGKLLVATNDVDRSIARLAWKLVENFYLYSLDSNFRSVYTGHRWMLDHTHSNALAPRIRTPWSATAGYTGSLGACCRRSGEGSAGVGRAGGRKVRAVSWCGRAMLGLGGE